MAGVAATVRGERAPARQVLATQGRQSPQNVLSSACQLLPRRRPNAAIEAPTSDPGAVQGKGARRAVVGRQERVAEQRSAVDLQRVCRHAPAFGPPKLQAARLASRSVLLMMCHALLSACFA